MSSRKAAYSIGAGLVVIHTIVLATCFFYSQSSHEEAPMVWLTLFFGDFPVSLGLLIPFLHFEGNSEWNNVYLPAIYHGVIGSIWWFFLPRLVIKLFYKNK